MIQNAGGQHYKFFAQATEENILEDKASKNTEVFSDEKPILGQPLDVQSSQVQDCQTITADVNAIPLELQSAQCKHEHEEAKPLSTKVLNNVQPLDSDESRILPSQPIDSATTDITKNQTSEAEIVQDQNSQIGTKAVLSPSDETGNKQAGIKPSKVKSTSSLLAKAISFLKGEKKSSIVSSSIALYGAQATILAGAIIGSPLGKKAMEIGEKVAKNAAEDLKEEASHLTQTLPALLWEESASPTPLPTPTPPATPSPEPVKVPSPVVVDINAYEKRIRKARAQLDEKKTPAFLAIQELLKVN